MATHLVTHVTFGEALAPGERLHRVLDALAASGQVEEGSWVVRPPFSADLRVRLGASKHGPDIPYDEPLAANQLRELLEAHPEDIDALAVDALTRLWIYARTHKPQRVEIDLYKTGLALFTDTRQHPLFDTEVARIEQEIADAEAAHEAWRVKALRADYRTVGPTLLARAIDWYFAIVERLASRARPAFFLVGRDSDGPTPISASMAWFSDEEAALEALRDDFSSRRYHRATAKALGRAVEAEGSWVLRMPPGFLVTNDELNPAGDRVEPFFAQVSGR